MIFLRQADTALQIYARVIIALRLLMTRAPSEASDNDLSGSVRPVVIGDFRLTSFRYLQTMNRERLVAQS